MSKHNRLAIPRWDRFFDAGGSGSVQARQGTALLTWALARRKPIVDAAKRPDGFHHPFGFEARSSSIGSHLAQRLATRSTGRQLSWRPR
jgi:hypothetical protein